MTVFGDVDRIGIADMVIDSRAMPEHVDEQCVYGVCTVNSMRRPFTVSIPILQDKHGAQNVTCRHSSIRNDDPQKETRHLCGSAYPLLEGHPLAKGGDGFDV